jgi:hypothetical protein
MSSQSKKTLIVCDVQPDVVQKFESPRGRLWVDLVTLALQAARQSSSSIVFTQLHFTQEDLRHIPATHPRLGILKKLAASNRPVPWFTSEELCVAPRETETLVRRTTFLPHSTDKALLEALQRDDVGTHEYTIVGYGPTAQALCHLLSDVLAAPKVQLIREAIGDDNAPRGQAFLEHGCLLGEQVLPMVDYFESLDLLQTPIMIPTAPLISKPPTVKYVCDVGRGGHLSLFLQYLTKHYGYVNWPTQPWYQEQKTLGQEPKQFFCPLGRRIVDLCDEPQFGSAMRFFLVGRKHLDEKDLLYALVPELMPPTFATVEDAHTYAAAAAAAAAQTTDDAANILWFLKKVNQNGGRAVQVLKSLPNSLEADDQLQAHIPRPLLWGENNRKCHVKTYQWIGCTQELDTGRVEWQIYQHDLYYLATATNEWSTEDTSDEVQITTMRTQRLYRDHPWRIQWKLTDLCQTNLRTVFQRAIDQGKLEVPAAAVEVPSQTEESNTTKNTNASGPPRRKTVQFEIHSADWMLDRDGRMYLIECNGIPVLYDPGQKQPLLTKGLQLYDGLYQEDPKGAVVNDHELMRDAVQLAMNGTLPKDSLWVHLMTVPAKALSEE